MSNYDKAFYEQIEDSASSSARIIVPLVLKLLEVKSVVDVGCGLGAWLRAFQDRGITDFLGIDGQHVDSDSLGIPVDRFMAADLSRPLRLERKFDLVISLEVAEHLPEVFAEDFVGTLTSMGDAVLFSAAIPGQGGTCHINEQWQDYWAEIFLRFGFDPLDVIRDSVWEDSSVAWWYAQNLILYVKHGCAGNLLTNVWFPAHEKAQSLNRTHPKLEAKWDWNRRKSLVQRYIEKLLEEGYRIAVTSPEIFDEDLESHQSVSHFFEQEGHFKGNPPTDKEALDALRALATRKIDVLVIPWITSWYAEIYPTFWERLENSSTRLEAADEYSSFQLRN